MKVAISMLAFLLLAVGSQAATLVDDFETYDVGAVPSPWVITDGAPAVGQESGGNQYTESYGSYRGLAGVTISDSDTETTVFYRIFKPAGTSPDCSIGLSNLAAPQGDWNDFEAYVVVVSGNLLARNGSGNQTIVSLMAEATWYNIWLVINNNANTYDVYVTTGSADAASGDRVANDFVFRKSTADDLVAFKVYGRSDGPVRVDDIYISGGLDLTIPVSSTPAPVIVTDPSDAAANETQQVVLETVFTSESTPSVEWYKVASPDDILLDTLDADIDVQLTYDSQFDQYTSVLTMSNLQAADAGRYYCKVTNESGLTRISKIADLLIYGLVAHWSLDQNDYDGSDYLDQVDNHHAAVTGTPTFVVGADGTANGAVQITETSGWAMAPVFDPVQQSGQMTISFWANWSQTLVTEADLQADSSAGEQLIMANGLKADGQWQHVCTVYDGTTGKLYVDGVLRDQGSWQLPGETQAAINIGISRDETKVFNGAMDDVRLYNYAMTEFEVADLRYALSGDRSCILEYAAAYDLSGAKSQPDCVIDLYDLVAFATQWLSQYDMDNFSELANDWQSTGLYPILP